MAEKNQILKELKEKLLAAYPEEEFDVILFGSRSRGLENEFSDYDILVISGKPLSKRDENRILGLCFEIDLKFDILIDLHLLSKNEIDTIRGKQPIFLNAIKNGIYA